MNAAAKQNTHGRAKTVQARNAAFAKLAPIRAQLVERLSRGAYSTQEQKEWAEMPSYMRDLAMVMAGLDERDGEASLLAFTAKERTSIMQALGLLKRDLRGVVALAYGVGGVTLGDMQ